MTAEVKVTFTEREKYYVSNLRMRIKDMFYNSYFRYVRVHKFKVKVLPAKNYLENTKYRVTAICTLSEGTADRLKSSLGEDANYSYRIISQKKL